MTITYEGGTEQIRQIVHHHAMLRRDLERRAGAVCDAVAGGVPCRRQVAILCRYLGEEILPHADAEERTLCRAAAAQACGSELVPALIHEHRELAYLAGRLQPDVDGGEAATVAEWIATLFAGHVAKVNDLLLPALIDSGADLAALLADMHGPRVGATPGSPTNATSRPSRPDAGSHWSAPGPGRSGRCGPPPASRTPPTTTPGTSPALSPPA